MIELEGKSSNLSTSDRSRIQAMKDRIHTQHGPSPCCEAILLSFVSGGGPKVRGPYVMCHECGEHYTIDYKTGVLK